MSEQNGGGPTLAAEAFKRLTTVVRAPKCGVDLLIRRIADYELLEATAELPTAVMTKKEALAYFDGLPPPDKAEYLRRAELADERIIAVSVLSPRVVQDYDGSDKSIPASLLRQDRIFLVRAILDFSRLLPEPPLTVPEPGPAEVPAEAFRAGLDAPTGVLPVAGAQAEPGAPTRPGGV